MLEQEAVVEGGLAVTTPIVGVGLLHLTLAVKEGAQVYVRDTLRVITWNVLSIEDAYTDLEILGFTRFDVPFLYLVKRARLERVDLHPHADCALSDC